jgi:hypothetical protein
VIDLRGIRNGAQWACAGAGWAGAGARAPRGWPARVLIERGDVRSLVIDPAKVDPDVKIFRLKGYLAPVLMEKTLANQILAAGFQRCFFMALNKWRGR